MHSYFSASNQPYQYHDYVIFVAEVASTFNEQLLLQHLLEQDDRQDGARLPAQPRHRRDPHDLIRQTMFAEFERQHARAGGKGRAADGGLPARASTASCSRPTSARTSSSTRNSSWSACASRTSIARSTSTSTPPASRPPSPSPSACSMAARRNSSAYLSLPQGRLLQVPAGPAARMPAWI